jgi:hypothetical protein
LLVIIAHLDSNVRKILTTFNRHASGARNKKAADSSSAAFKFDQTGLVYSGRMRTAPRSALVAKAA